MRNPSSSEKKKKALVIYGWSNSNKEKLHCIPSVKELTSIFSTGEKMEEYLKLAHQWRGEK